MGRNFFDKVTGILGLNEEMEEEREQQPQRPMDLDEEETTGYARGGRAKPTLISLPNNNAKVKIVVMEPQIYDEVQGMVEHLKAKKAVIINLESTSPEISKQVIDFLSGAIYALDGSLYKIKECVFVASPSNIEITAELRKELQERTMPFWSR